MTQAHHAEPLASIRPTASALVDRLIAACVDRELALRCLGLAMGEAGWYELPEDATALLAFVHEYLEPALAEELGPRTARTMVQDLEEDALNQRYSGVRAVQARVDTDPMGGHGHNLTARPPAAPTTRPPPPAPPLTAAEPRRRPTVAVVDADRFRRASLARALLSAGCDVVPFDDASELLRLFGPAGPDARLDAVVLDRHEPDAEDALAALRAAFPHAPVLPRSSTTLAVRRALGR